jgi:hypothetical protein
VQTSLRLAIILVTFSGHALAAKAKKGAPKAPVATMDQADPVEKEQSEKTVTEVKAKTQTEIDAEIAQRETQADIAQVEKQRARSKFGMFGNVLIGFGHAPVPGPGADETTGATTSATFMVGGYYDLSADFTLGARLPWTIGSARQPNGDRDTVQALGALELMGEYRKTLNPFLRLPIFFGLGLPTAQGAYPDQSGDRQAELNAMADAASGYRDPELFGPKRLPLIAGVGLDYQRKALRLRAATKFVLGVKVGGELGTTQDPSGGTYELKPVTFRNVTSGGIAYHFLNRPNLYGAFDTWLVYSAVNAVEFNSAMGATAPTRFQAVFEPRIGAIFGKISPSIGYIFPIGGRLADSSSSGLELHCDVAF